MTEHYVGGRQTGKSTQMLLWMLRETRKGLVPVMVCMSGLEAERMYRESEKKLGPGTFKPEQFISISDVGARPRVGDALAVTYGVDNAELVLSALLRGNVGACSWTDGTA